MDEAHLKLTSEVGKGRLAATLSKGVDQMDAVDLLVAYAFSAYLLEARPDALRSILESVGHGPFAADGAGSPAVDVVPDELGLGLDELEAHLVRWLSERR